MSAKRQEIVYLGLDEIIPYDKNPRKNTPAVPFCKASIKEFGFRGVIDIDENHVIIRGHTRRLALKELLDEGFIPDNCPEGKIPCIIHRDLPPSKIRAFRIADNKISEKSGWDDSLLMEEIGALPDIDFMSLGFDEMVFPSDEAPSEQELNSDGQDEKPYILKITFQSAEDLNAFLKDSKDDLENKYGASLFCSGGGL